MFPIQQFIRFAMNPAQFINQSGIQLPQDCNNPDQIIQYLMNSGKLNQQQYNSFVNQAKQIQKDPLFTQMINSVNTSK